MNCSCQANADDAYTPPPLLIAAHLFLIFQPVSCTRVDGFDSYEYTFCSIQAGTDASYTTSQLLIATHLFLIF